MSRNAGFTLLEIAIVLGIIAILAAIMTPAVTTYVDQARIARADLDTTSISEAILLHKRDTGRFPVFNTVAAANSGTVAAPCMVSGTGTALPTGTNHVSWTTLCTTRVPIQNYLNINILGLTTNANDGNVAFRGPYLDGLDGLDPWGQPYVITTSHLDNQTYWAFVASAGPNGGLNTVALQTRASGSLTKVGDDIVSLIH